MRISDWSSDVCSSDLAFPRAVASFDRIHLRSKLGGRDDVAQRRQPVTHGVERRSLFHQNGVAAQEDIRESDRLIDRSEEHTPELQSLMRNSYAVFCLKQKLQSLQTNNTHENSTQ